MQLCAGVSGPQEPKGVLASEGPITPSLSAFLSLTALLVSEDAELAGQTGLCVGLTRVPGAGSPGSGEPREWEPGEGGSGSPESGEPRQWGSGCNQASQSCGNRLRGLSVHTNPSENRSCSVHPRHLVKYK